MRKQIILLVIFALVGACETAELAPRTNPRFSMAYIQDVDATGAQFASNIYDFGSEEILEYGFLYSNQGVPRFNNSEVIRQAGKPERHFVLKGEHSMVNGRTYYVVAFLQTSSGVVFSSPQSFVSQGAAGFVFEKMEYKEPVFFGDTVTVYGSKFSSNSANYSVIFQHAEAKIIDVQNDSFKFIIPEFYDFRTYGPEQDIFSISIQILDKKVEMYRHMPFKDAEFDEMEIQHIDYGGTIEVRGEYLKDANIKIITTPYSQERIYYGNVTMESVENDRLVFKPDPTSAGQPNHVMVEIRGKTYNLGTEVFEYNPTEIDPGQYAVLSRGKNLTIKGRNFNVAAPTIHFGVLNGEKIEIDRSLSDSETLTFGLALTGTRYKRINEIKIQTFDKVSQHAITLELTDPDIPYLRNTITSLNLSDFLTFGNMTGYDGKGFALGNKEIFEFDISRQSVNTVRALQIGANQLRFTFGVAYGENWYIGGGQTSNLNPVNRSFFVFNLRTKEIRRLPDLPLDQYFPTLVHAVNDQVYIEGGMDVITRVDHSLRYKFDLKTEKWTRLPDKTQVRGVSGRTVAFSYNGRHLAIGEPIGTGDEGTGLFEFDMGSETWKLIKRFEGVGNVDTKTDEVFVVGNKAILMGVNMVVLDLETLELRPVTNLTYPTYLNCEVYRTMAFMTNGKIYAWDCDDTLWEIDPDKFEF